MGTSDFYPSHVVGAFWLIWSAALYMITWAAGLETRVQAASLFEGSGTVELEIEVVRIAGGGSKGEKLISKAEGIPSI
jgi:hypothetical protein